MMEILIRLTPNRSAGYILNCQEKKSTKGENIHILVMKYSCQLHHVTVVIDSPELRLVVDTEVMSTEMLSIPLCCIK